MRKGVIMEENGYTKAPQEGYYVPEEPNPGMAVAGMICGILSIVLCCCSQYITLILAVVGLGLSGYVLAKQKAGTGMAIARARMLDLWIAYFGLSDHRKFVFCGKSEHYFEGDTAAFSIVWFFEDINIYG